MSKVRYSSEIAPNIAFPTFNFYKLYYSTFKKSELGRIKKLLPRRGMAENFGLVRKSMRPKLGRRWFFTPEGKSGPDVPEDVHGTQLSEITGAAERQHPLPEILRRDNRSDSAIDELQAVGRHNYGICQSDGGCNGRLVRDTERVLRFRSVKVRTKRTEIMYILLGIHKANVVQLADRIEQRARLAAA